MGYDTMRRALDDSEQVDLDMLRKKVRRTTRILNEYTARLSEFMGDFQRSSNVLYIHNGGRE